MSDIRNLLKQYPSDWTVGQLISALDAEWDARKSATCQCGLPIFYIGGPGSPWIHEDTGNGPYKQCYSALIWSMGKDHSRDREFRSQWDDQHAKPDRT